jgi:polygalacturonase
MKKIAILALAFTLLAFPARAKDINVKSLGAKADGKTKVTRVIQKAIDAVSAAGGGRVTLSGGTFLSGPIEIKSGVELFIDADAVLLASPDISDFPDRTDARHYNSENLPRKRNAAFIFADEAENIAIGGRGIIDCNGQHHVARIPDEEYSGGWTFRRIHPTEKTLPRVVFFAGCRNVSVTDVTMVNQPAGWSYWVHDCDFVLFDRCKILSDMRFPNNDGIHINCSRDVTVSNCIIEAGDDAVIVRANSRSLKQSTPCERVVVTNCTLKSWAYAIRLGWANDGHIRNCIFSNLVITNSWLGIGMDFPNPGYNNDFGLESSLIEDIIFSNIIMDEIYECPIHMYVYPDEAVKFEGIRNIYFTDVHTRSLCGPEIFSPEDHPYENLVFTNCSFTKVAPEEFPMSEETIRRRDAVGEGMTRGSTIVGVKGLVLTNTVFQE